MYFNSLILFFNFKTNSCGIDLDMLYVFFQAKLFSKIQKNDYKFMYLSARPIGQVCWYLMLNHPLIIFEGCNSLSVFKN